MVIGLTANAFIAPPQILCLWFETGAFVTRGQVNFGVIGKNYFNSKLLNVTLYLNIRK